MGKRKSSTSTELFPKYVLTSARFSVCERYRYRLTRVWEEGTGSCVFVMLNPSTADATKNDPTVERCERRARGWGFKELIVVNLFAWRSTDPTDLRKVPSPVGVGNTEEIIEAATSARLVVCAWGSHGSYLNRGDFVRQKFRDAHVECYALRVNQDGSPAHPLYVPYGLTPKLWKG